MKKEILLSYFPKITVKRFSELISVFSNLENAWEAGTDDLKKTGWKDEIIAEFLTWKRELDEEKIAKILDHENIHCVLKNDENYPSLLKEIYDPPFCLFVRGELPREGINLAIVGTRRMTAYGKQMTEELAFEMAGQGITIVSGLALGIDGVAHEAALKAGGKTIAVLGSGNNDRHIFPRNNFQLAQQIIKSGGAVITEYPPGTLSSKYTFPRRNRIVAGLSIGSLVIEAPEESGALITAQCALDNNREVFAVPQNINNPNSVGPNNLIKNGAKIVTCITDILETLNLHEIKQFIANKKIIPDSPIEAKIIPLLSKEPKHVDLIIKESMLDSPTVNATLTLMEMKGKAKNLGGMQYILGK